MPRKKSEKKEVKKSPVKTLLTAVSRIEKIYKKKGSVQEQYCLIKNKWIVACDKFIEIAIPIEEDFSCCPHIGKLKSALSKVKDEVSITVMDSGLSIVSGAFKALVPCVPPTNLFIPDPDPPVIEIGDELKNAFEMLYPLCDPKAQFDFLKAVLINGKTAVSCNDKVLIEYTHNYNIPLTVLIPKTAATLISKTKKQLTWFGYSENTCSFWFDDNSMIKTLLHYAQIPDYMSEFSNRDGLEKWDIPADFFEAVASIKDFSEGVIYFKKDKIASTDSELNSSTYSISGLPDNMAFELKHLLFFKKGFKHVSFIQDENKAILYGDNIKGIIKSMEIYDDDNIPF